MSRDHQSFWMVSPQHFISILGAEYSLMRGAGVLRRFYFSSLLIVVVMLLTWVSIDYAIDLLFHSIVAEIVLAVFFCLLFVCIYIFLINTFAKENRGQKGIMTASNIIRIGFVAFMAFLIAQPLVILLYSTSLSPAVENYKNNLLKIHVAKIDSLVNGEMAGLADRQKYCMDQKDMFGTALYDEEIHKINERIIVMQDKATQIERAARQTIDRNSFFLYRVQTINRKYPLSWLLTLFIVLLFLLPGYLIYSISNQHAYYQDKRDREKMMVTADHSVFVERYIKMFDGRVSIFSRFDDPPFNTVRKQPTIAAPMSVFLQKYLDNDSSS